MSIACSHLRRGRASRRTILLAILLAGLPTGLLVGSIAGCGADQSAQRLAATVKPAPPHLEVRGGWLAPRAGFPLDSAHGDAALAGMRDLGVTTVAIGHDVEMPVLRRPALRWGASDAALRGVLRRVRRHGLQCMLMPRIESPEFFVPPFPFRADIEFATAADWDRFHDQLERMVLHYARLAQEEGVSLFAVGLELKHSVRRFPDRWRQLIAAVRTVFRGKLTYSANWYDEWREVAFWDALDFIGIGAYFELGAEGTADHATQGPGGATTAQLVARWQPIVVDIAEVAQRFARPVLFTEVGYTGYVDCAERPWEWAGKADKGIAIDHLAQARAFAALCEVAAAQRCIAGLCLWTFYTDPPGIAAWEYSVQGRPAAAVVGRFYRADAR